MKCLCPFGSYGKMKWTLATCCAISCEKMDVLNNGGCGRYYCWNPSSEKNQMYSEFCHTLKDFCIVKCTLNSSDQLGNWQNGIIWDLNKKKKLYWWNLKFGMKWLIKINRFYLSVCSIKTSKFFSFQFIKANGNDIEWVHLGSIDTKTKSSKCVSTDPFNSLSSFCSFAFKYEIVGRTRKAIGPFEHKLM